MQTALKHGLPLVIEGMGRLRPGLAWFGLSLMVPPLALLMSLGLIALAGTTALALLGATATPACILLALIGAVALLLAVAWARDGRRIVSAATLARIPLYLAWKIPVYLKLVRKRETEWVRTRRDDEA